MHVEVDGDPVDGEAVEPGLLLGLAERDGGEVSVAVGMTAGLQPLAELPVVQHDEPSVSRIDDERRPGQVGHPVGTGEGVGVLAAEHEHPPALRLDVGEVAIGDERGGVIQRSGLHPPTVGSVSSGGRG